MKLIGSNRLRVAVATGLQIALLAVVPWAADRAHGADRSAISGGGVEAKMEYCLDCHGPSGQGYRGYFPIPRLAGQQTEYLKNQLEAFVEHRRTNNIMFNVAHSLSPAMIAALAADFRTLNPRPIGGGPRGLVGAGERIFQNGVPDANVAACAACHGPEAQGNEEIPRLAGQLPEYTVSKLTNWSKERGQNSAKPDTSAIMSPVAHSLTKPQVEAVAAYLSYLK
jgi:cytochrome c553